MLKNRSLPFLLYSYIAAELLAPIFASFLILYGVFFLVRLTPLLEIVLDLHIGLADFTRMSSYIFPYMLLYVIPMASMTGVIVGFTRLTNDREILALKASGVSLRQILPPIILIAVIIATLTSFFSLRLIPAGETAMRKLMFQLAKEKIDEGIKEKTFTETLGDLVVYVDKIDKDKQWHGVYVSDMRGRKQPIITMAKTGHMVGESEKMMVTIVLRDGTLHNTDKSDNQVIQFKRYQLQIPLNPPSIVGGTDVTQQGRGSMTQQQLLEAANNYGNNTKKGIAYLTEYHHRLVLPVGCLILSLLGLPLGLQAGPGRKAVGIPLGLSFFVLYYILFTTFRVMCEDMVLPVVLGMWMPNILFLFLTLYVFYRAEQEKPILPEKLQDFISDGYDNYLKKGVKYLLLQLTKILSHRRIPTRLKLKRSSSMLVHANSHERIFHFPECEHYNCSRCTLKFKDAGVALQAGFEPCRYCKTIFEKHNH